jgi:hypothetical protein
MCADGSMRIATPNRRVAGALLTTASVRFVEPGWLQLWPSISLNNQIFVRFVIRANPCRYPRNP